MKLLPVVPTLLAVLLSLSSLQSCFAFQVADLTPRLASTSLHHHDQQQQSMNEEQQQNSVVMSRAQWIQTAAGATMTMMMTPTVALAAKEDPALKGTKKDPAYEACLSQCIYECTKPKGMEQKTRAQCIPECKSQCATTKAQMMLGTPINKE